LSVNEHVLITSSAPQNGDQYLMSYHTDGRTNIKGIWDRSTLENICD